MKLNYYGNEDTGLYKETSCPLVHTPQELYMVLSDIWCEYTCAPRMRHNWSKENRTLGQCSVTAFLTQDLFGGEVYGIPLEDGSVHCFNKVEGHVFDLTSEQFDHPLDYDNAFLQSREEHFRKKEKEERYQYLKQKLNEKAEAM